MQRYGNNVKKRTIYCFFWNNLLFLRRERVENRHIDQFKCLAGMDIQGFFPQQATVSHLRADTTSFPVYGGSQG